MPEPLNYMPNLDLLPHALQNLLRMAKEGKGNLDRIASASSEINKDYQDMRLGVADPVASVRVLNNSLKIASEWDILGGRTVRNTRDVKLRNHTPAASYYNQIPTALPSWFGQTVDMDFLKVPANIASRLPDSGEERMGGLTVITALAEELSQRETKKLTDAEFYTMTQTIHNILFEENRQKKGYSFFNQFIIDTIRTSASEKRAELKPKGGKPYERRTYDILALFENYYLDAFEAIRNADNLNYNSAHSFFTVYSYAYYHTFDVEEWKQRAALIGNQTGRTYGFPIAQGLLARERFDGTVDSVRTVEHMVTQTEFSQRIGDEMYTLSSDRIYTPGDAMIALENKDNALPQAEDIITQANQILTLKNASDYDFSIEGTDISSEVRGVEIRFGRSSGAVFARIYFDDEFEGVRYLDVEVTLGIERKGTILKKVVTTSIPELQVLDRNEVKPRTIEAARKIISYAMAKEHSRILEENAQALIETETQSLLEEPQEVSGPDVMPQISTKKVKRERVDDEIYRLRKVAREGESGTTKRNSEAQNSKAAPIEYEVTLINEDLLPVIHTNIRGELLDVDEINEVLNYAARNRTKIRHLGHSTGTGVDLHSVKKGDLRYVLWRKGNKYDLVGIILKQGEKDYNLHINGIIGKLKSLREE